MTGAAAGQRAASPETRAASPIDAFRGQALRARRLTRQTFSGAGQLAQVRRADMQQLRARHRAELAEAGGRSRMLVARARALARAAISSRFAHRWALIMQQKDAPDFTAKVAALEAEQAAALSTHTAQLIGVVQDERRLSRAWLKARQRIERRRLADSFKLARYDIPIGRYPAFGSPADIRRNRRRQVFMLAGRVVTTRVNTTGVPLGAPRLAFRRGR